MHPVPKAKRARPRYVNQLEVDQRFNLENESLKQSSKDLHFTINGGEGEHDIAKRIDTGNDKNGPKLSQNGIRENGPNYWRKVADRCENVKHLRGRVLAVEKNVAKEEHQNGCKEWNVNKEALVRTC